MKLNLPVNLMSLSVQGNQIPLVQEFAAGECPHLPSGGYRIRGLSVKYAQTNENCSSLWGVRVCWADPEKGDLKVEMQYKTLENLAVSWGTPGAAWTPAKQSLGGRMAGSLIRDQLSEKDQEIFDSWFREARGERDANNLNLGCLAFEVYVGWLSDESDPTKGYWTATHVAFHKLRIGRRYKASVGAVSSELLQLLELLSPNPTPTAAPTPSTAQTPTTNGAEEVASSLLPAKVDLENV